MSAQLKHTDAAAPEKRRRGAAGRAAALRRAPSDSDCSGETASLSADSGERRPPPPPPPRGKTRSRRRGSEWEVLEGLKDGQRFERRPEVFNGFLHKKRKWPLKGWHKRFFVVDGGILVYARSPTDVARGRLHGSLDVGLSVISAKPRRRRIDIDADEFIYHLRAKTPDVFRTWLNVLKAHRLYRQHLLTFGARESVPKIHAPLDDLPPTDNSSRISQSSLESFSSLTQTPTPKNSSFRIPSNGVVSSVYNIQANTFEHWNDNREQDNTDCLIPLESCYFHSNTFGKELNDTCRSLCSTQCIKKRQNNLHDSYKMLPVIPISEQQMHSTDLDINTIKNSPASDSNDETKPKKDTKLKEKLHDTYLNYKTLNSVNERSGWRDNKDQTTLFCFSPKSGNRIRNGEWVMRRSRKCTNLVKYRNVTEEPILTKPLLRQMILCKYKLNVGTRNLEDAAVNCDLKKYYKVISDKATQDEVSASEYDKISEKLIINLFETPNDNNMDSLESASKSSILVNRVVKELYDLNTVERQKYPIKFLFKALLQYFLKNTQGKFRGSCQQNVAVTKPSNSYFTDDKNMYTTGNDIHNEIRLSRSTQDTLDLEKQIRSNIYFSTTARSNSIVETDIKITKTLIDNLDTSAMHHDDNNEVTDASELPLLQEYIKHLMSETCLPKDVAKDFLNAYLEVLGHSSKSNASTDSNTSREFSNDEPVCDIQTECVQRKATKCVSVNNINPACDLNSKINARDQRQLNLKEMLDSMISLFTCYKDSSESYKQNFSYSQSNTEPVETKLEAPKNETSDITLDTLVSDILDDNTIVIDLTKFDVENLLMSNNADVVGTKLLTINLKEKLGLSESKLKRLSLKFNNNSPPIAETSNTMSNSNKNNPFYQVSMKSNNPFKYVHSESANEENSISSKTISKTDLHKDSNQSLDVPFNNDMLFHTNGWLEKMPCPNYKDNTQCYFLSSIQEDVPLTAENKRKIKENDGFTLNSFSPQTLRHKDKSRGIVNKEFILCVFRKLIALTKDIPSINNEIKSMYLHLKNMDVKSTENVSKVSLLGNINGTKICRESLQGTRINSPVPTDTRHNIKAEVAINTSFANPKLRNVTDKALSAIFAEVLANIGVQTLSIDSREKNVNDASIFQHNMNEKRNTDEKDEWFRNITKEYLETMAIKCILRKYHNLPQSIRIAHPIKAKIPDKIVTPLNSSVLTDLSSISPPLTISNRSQEDKQKIDNNSDVYQLFIRTKSKANRSESMTDCSEYNVRSDMSDDLKTLYRCTSDPYCSGLISPNAGPIRGPQAGFVSGTPGGRLAGWIVESGGPLESASRELGQAQLSVQQLQRLLDAMLEQHQLHHDTDVSLEGASPNVKKDRRKFGLRKKKSNSKCASVELSLPHVDCSSSHMALSALTAPPSPGGGAASAPNSAASLPIACAAARPQSLPGAEALGVGAGGPASITSLTPDHQLREDFTILAKDLVANLKTVVSTLVVERGRLRAAVEAAGAAGAAGAAAAPAAGGVVAALRTNLTSALQQNSELRTRLSRIHDASDLAEISSVGNNSDQVTRQFPQSLSYSSSCVSASEFFDAEEHEDEFKPAEIINTDEAGVIELDGDSSSEAGSLSSEEGSASSDNSDGATSAVIPGERSPLQNGAEPRSRRARLPCPRPTPASPSLWNLLYKNIGKDLSQISMPVTINEPLNMLQRLCEELEYSSLLDSASDCTNELERMALVAAFAVSAYAASAHRAASKPFNPLLAETYECIRTDRDFRFLAEQVSHHPPISACHAESPRWTFWQEARIKTKFWGKSMEFQPTGRVHVRLSPSGDHYSWNKVTTCVHNLFGGQRWVDQYGDMHIVCHGTDITCKLQFIKASSWSSGRHEVRGAVCAGGAPRMRLQGRWSEGLQAGERTLWRPGAMPPDYELYYGFTRFAMELNELEPGMRDVLPFTDTRLRPDQRALEEGDVDAAEQFKHDLEQAQRERRRDGVEHSAQWFRKTMEDGEETWLFTGEYWRAREAGFTDTPRLW